MSFFEFVHFLRAIDAIYLCAACAIAHGFYGVGITVAIPSACLIVSTCVVRCSSRTWEQSGDTFDLSTHSRPNETIHIYSARIPACCDESPSNKGGFAYDCIDAQ